MTSTKTSCKDFSPLLETLSSDPQRTLRPELIQHLRSCSECAHQWQSHIVLSGWGADLAEPMMDQELAARILARLPRRRAPASARSYQRAMSLYGLACLLMFVLSLTRTSWHWPDLSNWLWLWTFAVMVPTSLVLTASLSESRNLLKAWFECLLV